MNLNSKILRIFIKFVLLISVLLFFGIGFIELAFIISANMKLFSGFLVYLLSLIFLILNNLIPLLVAVAFFTVGERKLLASIQRRTGPGKAGFWGSLQAIADGAKLVVKETLIPVKANFYLFLTAPIVALFLAFISWGFIPFNNFSFFFDNDYGILVILSLSSLNVYSVVLAGWSSNSKYTFLGGLRSCAQMISYEISISIILIAIFLNVSSLNFITIVNYQEKIWFIFPLFPLAIMFLISIVAETNRTPFDLPEAEAELVAGFNLEYSSIVFAFFFLQNLVKMFLFVVMIINPDFTDLLQQKQQLVAQLQQRQVVLTALMNHRYLNNTSLSLDEQKKLTTALTSAVNENNSSNIFKHSSYFSFFFF